MRFKTDENLPIELADLLRKAGHDAMSVVDQHMGGEADPDLAAVCERERRTLVTFDLGFSDLRIYPPQSYPGLIVLRLKRQERPLVLEVFERLLPLLETEPLEGHLWIVEEERVRVRSMIPRQD
ncbi:MAG TPA: DUF5615 family PIN-like protein [Thermoanaerobaculia bacterium]|nr:DUF5615 family PIN-like protein [Thermoanaerobaculia bacterium]